MTQRRGDWRQASSPDIETAQESLRPRGATARRRLRLAIATCLALPALLATTGFSGGDGSPGGHGSPDTSPHGPELSFIDLQRPAEDILPLPGTKWVVLSSITSATHEGGLTLINRRTEEQTPLWPVEDFSYAADREAFPGCDGPPDEADPATHGINAVQTGPRSFDLYVVYHGSRESIEVFSLDVRGKQPEASWRGCVVLPEGTAANSVVGLPHGGIAMTNFSDPNEDLLTQLFSGDPTGSVFTWHRESGWTEVPGSDMRGPNGIEASPDGATLYVAESMTRRIVSIPTTGGTPTVLAETPAETPFLPDNLRWTDSGTLLTTGVEYEPLSADSIRNCAFLGEGCVTGFVVIEVDPVARTSETVFSTTTAEYQYATVAAQVGREIWVGSNATAKIAVVSGLHHAHPAHNGAHNGHP